MSRYREQPPRSRATRLGILTLAGVFFLGLGVFMAREKRLEVDRKKAQLAAEGARLEELRSRRDALEQWKEALECDAWAVEEAIRRKLHWVRPGERVLTWEGTGLNQGPITVSEEAE